VRLGGIDSSFDLQVNPVLIHRASKTNAKLSGEVGAKVASGGRVAFNALAINNLAGRNIFFRFQETASQLRAQTGRFTIYPFAMQLSSIQEAVVAGGSIALSAQMNDDAGQVYSSCHYFVSER
jgi:hypothetical protein